jgi:radical SAM protein with 4Fe4S-binding SPASM domain
MPEGPADLTLQQVQAILDQTPDIQRVVLHGIGEPLLNPELPGIVADVKGRGAYVLFNTNGLLLRGRLVAPLLRSGLDELRVSVDSASSDTYKAIRGVDGLDRIFANVESLTKEKAALDSATPKVSLWITGMKTNVLELPALVERAASIGITEVYLQRLVYSGRGNAREEEALFRRAPQAELDAIAEAGRLAEALGVTLRGSGEASALELVSEYEEDVNYHQCRRPWSLMYVTANGNVLPCCIAPFTEAPYEDIKLGNVFDVSLEEVWNGPLYRKWRERMNGNEPPEACRGCGVNWSL